MTNVMMNKPIAIKICGLSTPEAVEAAIDGGASHMGFIFFERSPRHVTIDQAEVLSNKAGNRIKKVAVSVDASDDFFDEVVSRVKPYMLQLHGSESPQRVQFLKERYGIPVMKVISVSQAVDLEAANAYLNVSDWLLFDAKAPEGSDLPGGNGVAFNWNLLGTFKQDIPYMLSGGLNVDNVEEALALSGTAAIDVSSGVETAPGQKDPALIREFLEKLNNMGQKKAAS